MSVQEIDLFELLDKGVAVLRRTWIFSLLLIVVSLVACYGYMRYTYIPIYESQATFAISREMNGEKNYQYNKKATDELAVSFSSIVSSDVMADAMRNDLGEKSLPATLSAKRIGTTNLFTVVASGKNAEDVTRVIQAFLDNYARVFRITLMDIELEMIEKPVEQAKICNAPDYQTIFFQVACIIIGLYIAIVFVCVWLKQTIIEEEDVKKWLRIPCIGAMPYIRVAGKQYPLISADGSRYFDLKDAVGSVRRSLEKEVEKSGSKSYLFTGAIEGEGTSTIVANLALSLTNKGYKTALVDFDFRNPMHKTVLGEALQLKEEIGKIEFKNIDLHVYNTEKHKKLHFYSTEKKTEEFSANLNTEAIGKLLERLSQKYDFVLIDSSPVLVASDTAILASIADATVFVVKADHLSVSKLTDALEHVNQATGSVKGCILNGSKRQISHYGYGYSYGYGYGYGYGKRYGKNA